MVQSSEQKLKKESSIHQTREDNNKIIPKITYKNKITCINKTKKRTKRADKNL